MSCNKNTIVSSSIDVIVSVLNNLAVPYSLETLGFVYGNGLNDDFFDNETKELTSKKYPIRKLSCQEVIIQEYMIRNHDCDSNDFLVSKEFTKEKYKQLPFEYHYGEE